MNLLTKSFFVKKADVFNTADVALTLKNCSRNSRNALIKRAIKSGDIINIRRGLYSLSSELRQTTISQFAISQRIYGPSYVSMESALSYHNWIPEAVYICSCASFKTARVFDTPIGIFEYNKVPQVNFFFDVMRVKEDKKNVCFIASPEKALCDYIYTKFISWNISDALESLRLESDFILNTNLSKLHELSNNYKSKRVKMFLKSWIEFINGTKK